MFAQVFKYVVGILSSVYGITTSVVSGVVNSVITGKLIVRATGGTAGTDELQISHDTSKTTFFNDPGVSGGGYVYNFQQAGTTFFVVQTDTATPVARINSAAAAATFAIGSTLAGSAGIVRVATGVLGPSNAGAAGGWFQNTDGEKRRTATQTVTDSTTFVADDTLSITVISGRKYRFYLWYAFTVVNTSGVKIDLNGGTAGMTAINGWIYLVLPSTGAVTNSAQITALTSSAALTATGTLHFGIAEGSFQASGNGTFIPRFAQNAETGAAESVVAQVGSYLTLADMP